MKKPFYKSKKFWATVTGCAAVFGKEYLGLDTVSTIKLVGILSAYVIGQGVADSSNNS